jgi:hypothetical protein
MHDQFRVATARALVAAGFALVAEEPLLDQGVLAAALVGAAAAPAAVAAMVLGGAPLPPGAERAVIHGTELLGLDYELWFEGVTAAGERYRALYVADYVRHFFQPLPLEGVARAVTAHQPDHPDEPGGEILFLRPGGPATHKRVPPG